nr:hypothetical protein [Candidatus Cloacimonadota bacterium]
MEKGMLNIRRNGKKVILGIVKENKKILSISDSSLRKAEIWEGIADGDHEVSYVLENGTNIIELTIGDKTIRPEQVQPPKQAGQGNRNFNNNDRSAQHPTGIDSAKAPYSFIPINEEVIFVDEKEVPAFNSYKGYDGYIELEIKAMSPIYIRRNLKPEEQEKEDALGHDHNNKEALAFKESLSGFNRPLDAAYRIPGSSLRGMIRTLYEIVTYSKMTMIDDHKLYFRSFADKSIGDLLPPKHKSNDLDMTEAVFGRIADNQAKMGRVYFEDAICIDPKETNAAQHPKILSAPKPSSFQLYLHQDKNAIKLQGKKIKFLNNYNTSGARLAGHKLYWHRDPKDWVADKQEVTNHQTQYTMIQPLDTGSVFKGRIRFLNLSKEELGALLFVLNLPEGCCHKLGMAKPLGLGSVRLNAQLSLIDRKKRYSDLTSLGISATEDGEYVNAFINFLRDKLGLKGDIWETERLKELKRILDFAYKPDNEQTRYMEIEHGKNQEQRKVNEYSNRPILKKPSEIDNLTTKALKIGTEPQK